MPIGQAESSVKIFTNRTDHVKDRLSGHRDNAKELDHVLKSRRILEEHRDGKWKIQEKQSRDQICEWIGTEVRKAKSKTWKIYLIKP